LQNNHKKAPYLLFWEKKKRKHNITYFIMLYGVYNCMCTCFYYICLVHISKTIYIHNINN
jgi:hypothetical protein